MISHVALSWPHLGSPLQNGNDPNLSMNTTHEVSRCAQRGRGKGVACLHKLGAAEVEHELWVVLQLGGQGKGFGGVLPVLPEPGR